jgi:hypothetical protein
MAWLMHGCGGGEYLDGAIGRSAEQDTVASSQRMHKSLMLAFDIQTSPHARIPLPHRVVASATEQLQLRPH